MITCLQIHNDYQIPGGETKTAVGIADLLEQFGINVIRYYKSNNSYKNASILRKLKIGIDALNNKKTVKEIQEIIDYNKVDFALIHNVLPIISNSVYSVLEKNEIPIIKYIQNYNLLCLNGAMDHEQKCLRCKNNNLWGVKNKCYKENSVYSLLRYFIKQDFDRKHYANIAAFMPNSQFVMYKHVEYGLDKNRMHVMYNYIDSKGYKNQNQYNSYYLYFGRISNEKGVFTVLKVAQKKKNIQFVFMGSGKQSKQLEDSIRKSNIENVRYIGNKNGEEMYGIIEKAKAVIVPSEWDEPLPRTILEAFSVGTPVIGTSRGGIPEMISIGTGYLYESGNTEELIECINQMNNLDIDSYNEMRKNCVKEIEDRYSKKKYYERFMECINSIV